MIYLASQIHLLSDIPNSVPDLVYALHHDDHQDGFRNGVECISRRTVRILST